VFVVDGAVGVDSDAVDVTGNGDADVALHDVPCDLVGRAVERIP
jgi:hypothetical protein